MGLDVYNCFAYIGPETFIPFASVLAAILGGILVFIRHPIQATRNLFMWFRRGKEDTDADQNEESE